MGLTNSARSALTDSANPRSSDHDARSSPAPAWRAFNETEDGVIRTVVDCVFCDNIGEQENKIEMKKKGSETLAPAIALLAVSGGQPGSLSSPLSQRRPFSQP